MKVVTILGARPQFIKAAPMCRALRIRHKELIIHTGQHYDDNMSAVFFRELGIPEPDIHLGAGGGTHAEQTGAMLIGIEKVLMDQRADWVLVYGDTNSTLAGALAAGKLHIPIAHVEAGLRSYNRKMPEEVNRVLVDHLSTLLLCPSEAAADNLAQEGLVKGVRIVGDVMADALFATTERAAEIDVFDRLGLNKRGYFLATVHRAENTDDPKRLAAIFQAFAKLPFPVLLPLHPRTRKILSATNISIHSNLLICDPLGYRDMANALGHAKAVLTDSGGIQKEAYWLSVPCITLRDETEWVETLENGWNVLVGADQNCILTAAHNISRPACHPVLYNGDGNAASRIVSAMEQA